MFIYKITHIESGKIYIGQTTGKVSNRWKEHCKGYKQPTSHLHRAIVKYGVDAFLVEQIDSASNLEELNALEEKYILDLNCLSPRGYNLLRGGNNRMCHPETKEKIRTSLKGSKITNRWDKGFIGAHTQETKDKIAAKLKGRPIKNRMNGAPKGRKVSAERRAQISKTLTGKSQPNKFKPVKVIQTGIVYESVAAASRATGIERTNLLHYLKSGKVHAKSGLSFVYLEKE